MLARSILMVAEQAWGQTMKNLAFAFMLVVGCVNVAKANSFCASLVNDQILPAAVEADRIRDKLNSVIDAKNFNNGGGCALAAQLVAAYRKLHAIEQPFFSNCMTDNRLGPLMVTAVERETKSTLWATKIDDSCRKLGSPQDKPKTVNAPVPKPGTMAADVLARLEATKDYGKLSALYVRRVAANQDWLQSAEGRALDAQLKNWRRDAAATAIVDGKKGRILQYSVGGVVVTDDGIAAADLDKNPAYRQTIAEAIAQNIVTSPLDPKVQAALAANE